MRLTLKDIEELEEAAPRSQAELRAIAAFKGEWRKRANAHKEARMAGLTIQYKEGRAQMETATNAWGDLSRAVTSGRVATTEGARKLALLRDAFAQGKELASTAAERVAEIRDVDPVQLWEAHTRSMAERLGPNVIRNLPRPPACLTAPEFAPRRAQ